jgi:hypothetical protein
MIVTEQISMIDGATRIVAILTNYDKASENGKTGLMAQLHFLVADQAPTEAIKDGSDVAICGDCPLRGDNTGKERACYVVLLFENSVWRAWHNGRYLELPEDFMPKIKGLRVGTYGDGASIDPMVLRNTIALFENWTMYSHQWRNRPDLRDIAMASVETAAQALEAQSAGFRTFRVINHGDELLPSEILCPFETGKVKSCAECGLCNGASAWKVDGTPKVKSIANPVHGNGAKHFAAAQAKRA